MADQTVKISNLNDGKHRVAYDMAISMWEQEHGGNYPNVSDQENFLDLVKECVKALNTGLAR